MSSSQDLFPPNQMAHPGLAALVYGDDTMTTQADLLPLTPLNLPDPVSLDLPTLPVDQIPTPVDVNPYDLPFTQTEPQLTQTDLLQTQDDTQEIFRVEHSSTIPILDDSAKKLIKEIMDFIEGARYQAIHTAQSSVAVLDDNATRASDVHELFSLIDGVVRCQLEVSLVHQIFLYAKEHVEQLSTQSFSREFDVDFYLFGVRAKIDSDIASLSYRTECAFRDARKTRNFLTQIYRSKLANIQATPHLHPCCIGSL